MSDRSLMWRFFPWQVAAPVMPHRITIFALHRFTSKDRGVRGHNPAAVAHALEFVRRSRIPILDLTSVVAAALAGERLPTRGVVFTVDDGYAEFPEIGMPVFAAYDCPVTLFVPTGFIDGDYWFWWDRLEYAIMRTDRAQIRIDLDGRTIELDCATIPAREASVRSLMDLTSLPHDTKAKIFHLLEERLEVPIPAAPPPQYQAASWNELRVQVSRGLTCGPHTVTHPILWTTNSEMMAVEIRDSIARLRARMPEGHTDILAYPQGCVSVRELSFLATVGCPAALLSAGGSVSLAKHLRSGPYAKYLIPRQGFEDPNFRHRQAITGVESAKQRVRALLGHPEPLWTGRTPDGRSPA